MGTHTTDIYQQIGERIRELRTSLQGKGISQEDLARAMKTTANTISRWETATYKPSVSDLENLASFLEFQLPSSFLSFNPLRG